MIDISTGRRLTRRDFGRGLAAILSAGVAPAVVAGGLRRGLAMRTAAMGVNGGDEILPYVHIGEGQYTDVCTFYVTPSRCDRFECSFRVTSLSSKQYDCYIGGWNLKTNTGLFFRRYDNSNVINFGKYFSYYYQYQINSTTLPMNDFATCSSGLEIINGSKVPVIRWNGNILETDSVLLNYTFTLSIHKLANEHLYSYGSMDLKYLKYYENGEDNASRHLIPVRRKADGVVCLFDKITGDYFRNEGTGGEFTAPRRG